MSAVNPPNDQEIIGDYIGQVVSTACGNGGSNLHNSADETSMGATQTQGSGQSQDKIIYSQYCGQRTQYE